MIWSPHIKICKQDVMLNKAIVLLADIGVPYLYKRSSLFGKNMLQSTFESTGFQ